MPLRAEHDVRLVQPHHGEEGLDRVRVDVTVGVAEGYVRPPRLPEPDLERMALPFAGGYWMTRTALDANESAIATVSSVLPSETTMIS